MMLSRSSVLLQKVVSWDRLLAFAPDVVTFTGRAGQYAEHRISVSVGKLFRRYVVNARPSRTSSFYVGGIFERVLVDGSQTSPLAGVQTGGAPMRGRSIFEIRLKEPALRMAVSASAASASWSS